jgi:poly(3-hydroxybutyrate) depolymerase
MNIKHLHGIVIFGLLLMAAAVAADPLDFNVDSLPAESLAGYNVDISQSSVSGLSAGAYMADQFFVAFSRDMLGVGIFAGGPYGCSNGDLNLALGRCMNPFLGSRIDDTVLQQLYTKAVDYENQGKIDPLDHLAAKKVYIFSGVQDVTVMPEVTDWVDDWYELAGVPPANIVYENDMNAPHALPTLDYGNACFTPGNPWMVDCDYDGAGQALTHILGDLNPPRLTVGLTGRFIKFYQNEFFEPGNLTADDLKDRFSMNEYGFAYVPEACSDGEPCRIHVVFHGCKQVYNRNPDASDFSPDDASDPFGLQYVKYAGYNEWADTNNLIILYPQAQKVQFSNPRGCYDWWGYLSGTADTYATKQGPQMKAVHAMMERLAGGHTSACEGDNQQPVIILTGDDVIELDIGAPLLLPVPEASAMDPEDGDITADIVRTPVGPVDTSLPGVTELIYNVQDSAGCMAEEVARTIIVRGCEQWTATNSAHAAEARAENRWCYWWFFFPYQCYYAIGSEDSLGVGSDLTTLRRADTNAEFYELGECP